MRLDWLRADLAGASRASVLLALLLAASMLATEVLAVLAVRQSGRELVVLVRPVDHPHQPLPRLRDLEGPSSSR